MTKCSARLIYFLTQAAVVCTEVLFTRSARGQSTHFSCVPEGPAGSLTGFQLYRLYPGKPGQQAQATLLSVGEGEGEGEGSGGPRLDPRYRGRLVVASGGLGASWVNLTLRDLRPGDTGLYATELISGTAASDSLNRSLPTCPQVLLLVDGTERSCQLCSSKYTALLYSIFTATVLLFLLLMTTWLARARRARAGRPHKPQSPVVIYEEMNSKSERRGATKPQNDPLSPSHLAEETAFPVYANTGVRQAEDNCYACPRQVTRPLLP